MMRRPQRPGESDEEYRESQMPCLECMERNAGEHEKR